MRNTVNHPLRPCPVCGREFQPRRADQEYCQVGCKSKSQRRRRAGLPIADRVPAQPDMTREELEEQNHQLKKDIQAFRGALEAIQATSEEMLA